MEIREYTQLHAELRAAHHFIYDNPLDKTILKPNILVLGINPGESLQDEASHPGPTEETWLYDFHKHGQLGRSQGSINWQRNVEFFAGSRNVVFSELFFWSSPNSKKEFRARFGALWESPHLPFCMSRNKLLMKTYGPRAILFAGLTDAQKVAQKLSLCHTSTLKYADVRLIEHYRDGERPWFFIRHWTGSFGFSNTWKDAIRRYIIAQIAE